MSLVAARAHDQHARTHRPYIASLPGDLFFSLTLLAAGLITTTGIVYKKHSYIDDRWVDQAGVLLARSEKIKLAEDMGLST